VDADEGLLNRLQCNSFGYFTHEADPHNGLVRDKTAADWPASIAAVGMALTAYPVGVQRGLMNRADALARTLATLRFFAGSDQSGSPGATGHRGFYFHFLEMQGGGRAWRCELSSIDTALFIAGALTAAAFFDQPAADETELRRLANRLYERIEWDWMLNGHDLLCHGWTPEHGFLRYHWQGYDEALILYLLALGSPTHPIPPRCYEAWAATYRWKRIYGIDYLHAGPLFIHQMSHQWVDFRGIRDRFMRGRGSDYFENSRRATLVQQQYAMRNPRGMRLYGEHCWGITASDGPGEVNKPVNGRPRRFHDYKARGVPYGPDDGTLAPWAVAASLPFAPEVVLPTLRHFDRLHLHTPNPYGFKASFNPGFPCDSTHRAGWVSPYHFGINEGPTVVMIENHRSGLVWSLTRQAPWLVAGLRAAGFEGGWLDAAELPASVTAGGVPAATVPPPRTAPAPEAP
jgi:hypothetical protein